MKHSLCFFNLLIIVAFLSSCNESVTENSAAKESGSKEDIVRIIKEDYFGLRLSDKESKLLKGNIKSMSTKEYYASSHFGEVKLDSIKYCENLIFDKDGYITYRDLDEKKDSFDQDFNRISYTKQQCVTFTHTIEGKKRTTTVKDLSGNIKSRIIRSCNDAGFPLQIDEYDSLGKLSRKCILKYNNDGKLVERSDYDKDGSTDSRTFDIKYNEAGYVQSYTYVYDWKEKLGHTTTIEYTSGGRVSKTENRNYGKSKYNNSTVIFEFKEGTLMSSVYTGYDDDGKEETRVESKYDKHENVTEWVVYYENELTQKSRYENRYDKYGNLTESIEYQDGEPVRVTKHTYEYYE